jgi:hypothetical protein
MKRIVPLLSAAAAALLLTVAMRPAAVDPLEAGFRNPPPQARPHTYWLWLNGHVNLDEARAELRAMKDAGFGGVLMFDMGGRGEAANLPPAGPAFLSPSWLKPFHDTVGLARQLGLQFDFSVISSWDLGGHWIEPRHASMGIFHSETTLDGGRIDTVLPMPPAPPNAPRDGAGKPLFQHEVAVLAVRDAARRPGHEFVWALDPPGVHTLKEAVLDNGDPRAPAALAGSLTPVRAFSIAVSDTGTLDEDFREVARGTLPAAAGPHRFTLPEGARARYVRLMLTAAHDAARPHWTLGEFSLLDSAGLNVMQGRVGEANRDGAVVIRAAAALGHDREWSLANLNNGTAQGPRGVFATAGLPALSLRDAAEPVNVTSHVDGEGRLRWDAPPGRWTVLRYVCLNTGERLKVPSPNSDGWATDHLNPEATRAHMRYVIARLRETFGDPKLSGITNLYLPSYEVTGPIWSPVFLSEFRKRRGYDMTPYLPALFGARVGGQDRTERFLFDYRKTLGEVLVDAYYGVARQEAHAVGLKVKSEAGGPGPPVHNVPVDSLAAHNSVDSIQGEFWPYRPRADALWVVKEPATAAHVYGRREVHLEAFTSMQHWQEGPGDLKPSADRVFTEGGNHFVWHTWTHNGPEAGLPGWVYLAGTHINRNVTWWPKAKPFLDYLSRTSHLLQQGRFVADVLYYYGDGGYKFVGPRRNQPSLGPGYDYDVANSDVLLNRLAVKNGRLTLPDGMSYAVLVLPDGNAMNPDVLAKLEKLALAGATIVGPEPSRAHGLEGYPAADARVRTIAGRLWAKGRVKSGITVRQALESMRIAPDFVAPEPFDYIHRRDGGTDIYFVRNASAVPAKGPVRFRVRGRQPELWDPVSGEIRDVAARFEGNATELALELPANGSTFVIFRRPATRSFPPAADVTRGVMAIDGSWTVDFEAGRGAPASVVLPSLSSWTTHADAGVRSFSGTATYRNQITVAPGWLSGRARVRLDLGRLWAIGEVRLNGKPLGIVWTPPYAVDCTAALTEGVNDLTVEVTNTWFNRLVGDAKLPPSQRITRTNTPTSGGKPWSALDPIESGLFGPVRIERLN